MELFPRQNLGFCTSLPDTLPVPVPGPLVAFVPAPVEPLPLPAAHNREGGVGNTCSECSIKGGLLDGDKKLCNGGRESILRVTLRS